MIKIMGLGLWDENSMTLKALKEAKDCDILYAEFYTSELLGSSIEKLEKKIGKKINVLNRDEVESEMKMLEQADKKKVGFLVGGDALTATTHIDILIEAEKKGIETKVIHGTSIFTASAGLTGLQIYKFGKTASMPYSEKGFQPETPYEIISENTKAGMHTLILLDIKPDRKMTANEAMKYLLEIEKKKEKGIFTKETEICIVARAGSDKPLVKFGKVKKLSKEEFGGPMHVLIVPGKLHFKEEEALKKWK
ncbi:MAG: diphthine synthase [Candidatus Undinarchaeales archaeon]